MRTFSSVQAEEVLAAPKWPEAWPFTAADFGRMDETPDTQFYSDSRLVYHIDDGAVGALSEYYAEVFQKFNDEEGRPPDVLDICSSWVSHYPKDAALGAVCGCGMNEYELSQNPVFTGGNDKEACPPFVAKDLNIDPVVPYPDASFDFVTCVVSVDYLNKPLEVFDELRRVLRPGGQALMAISNRCFPTKAIQIWLQTNDLEHIFIVGSYFHYSGGWEAPFAVDRSPNPGASDPMFIIQAKKKED
jgi:SAM-dependent methyltransferase